jgi:RNA polymerase sigma-B factor
MDKANDAMVAMYGRKPTQAEVATHCDLTETELTHASILSRIGDPRSLDESLETEDGDDGASLSDYIGYEDEGYNVSLDRLTLATALDTLPDREKTILQLRYFRSMSQRQTAEIVSISQMHVSRLERAALNKLRLVLQRSPNMNTEQLPVRATRTKRLARVS